MREIKFRAWDKEKKEMFNDIWIDGNFINMPEYIVMQFTGLKDKNGKEIYEGDIVKNIDRVFEVTFKDGYFSIIHNKKGLLYCEVIGNKYENSELLKE